jgi:DNA-binding MarR family transcriptional regulator
MANTEWAPIDDDLDRDSVALAGQLRLSITRLARILRQQDAGSLGPTMSSALATITHDGPLTLGELASREHVAPPSITKVVDQLEAKGLVRRAHDSHDRRVTRVETTAAGRRHIAQTRSRRTAWLAVRLDDLSAEDLERLWAASEVLERLSRRASEDATGPSGSSSTSSASSGSSA